MQTRGKVTVLRLCVKSTENGLKTIKEKRNSGKKEKESASHLGRAKELMNYLIAYPLTHSPSTLLCSPSTKWGDVREQGGPDTGSTV